VEPLVEIKGAPRGQSNWQNGYVESESDPAPTADCIAADQGAGGYGQSGGQLATPAVATQVLDGIAFEAVAKYVL
jgi:hypothetical protein